MTITGTEQTHPIHTISPSIADEDLPTIAIGVLNYNRASEAIATLSELAEIDYPKEKVRLILLDNASTDGSVEETRAAFGQDVEILQLPQNIGPVARNRVMLFRPEDYVFVFDEDCRPERPDTLRHVIEFMEANDEFGALCFACFNYHLGIREYGHPGDFYRRALPNGAYEGMYVIGNGMCFRSSMISRTEGYDERLLWGGEEYDLALELLYHDIPIAFHPDFVLIHYHAPRAHSSKRSWELDMRNNIWISFRRFPLVLSVPVVLTHIARRLLSSALKRDWIKFSGFLRGLRSGFARLPEFIATRKPVPVRKFIPHSRWFAQMFYSPRSFAADHKRAMREKTVVRTKEA